MGDGIKENALPGEEVYDRATWRRMSSHIKVGIMKRKKKKKKKCSLSIISRCIYDSKIGHKC